MWWIFYVYKKKRWNKNALHKKLSSLHYWMANEPLGKNIKQKATFFYNHKLRMLCQRNKMKREKRNDEELLSDWPLCHQINIWIAINRINMNRSIANCIRLFACVRLMYNQVVRMKREKKNSKIIWSKKISWIGFWTFFIG